jgi:hypothetical protein
MHDSFGRSFDLRKFAANLRIVQAACESKATIVVIQCYAGKNAGSAERITPNAVRRFSKFTGTRLRSSAKVCTSWQWTLFKRDAHARAVSHTHEQRWTAFNRGGDRE